MLAFSGQSKDSKLNNSSFNKTSDSYHKYSNHYAKTKEEDFE